MRPLTSITLALALTTMASQGQISFGPSQEISNFINYPRDTRAVDMDGDGDLDVISRESSTVKVIWWENDGNGNFPQRHVWTWGDLNFYVVSLEDANADGRPDVWIRTRISEGNVPPYARTFRYLIALGDENGDFGEPQVVKDFHYQNDSFNTSVRIGDMNHDGRADLLMADGIWMRQADGSFLPPPGGTFPPGTVIGDLGQEYASDADKLLAIDDFDGDGDPDLAFGAPGLMISFNLGDGMLAPPVSSGFMRANEEVDYLKSIPPAAGEERARLIVAASLQVPGSQVHDPRLALGAFSAAGEFTATAVEPFGNYIHAITWDAESDRVIIASYSGPAPVPVPDYHAPLALTSFALPSTGTSFVKAPIFQTDGMANELPMADLDGDGSNDLIVPLSAYGGVSGMFAGELRWYRNIGSGQFNQSQPSISQPAMGGEIAYAGDVDRDGDGDIITADKPILFGHGRANSPGYLKVILWENAGAGTSFKRRILSEDHHAVDVIAVTDSDGDGDLDVLIQTYEILGVPLENEGWESYGIFRLTWLMQDEQGAFAESVRYEGSSIGLLDNARYLDWDGLPQSPTGPSLPDVVGIRSVSESQRQPVYFRGLGMGFGTMQVIDSSDESYIYGAWDDLDQDGDPDFSWAENFNFPGRSFWLRNDQGAVGARELLPRYFVSADADLDGDGFNDHYGNGVVFLSRPDFGTKELTFPSELYYPAYADMDGDGDLDILSPNPTLGIINYSTLIWFENDGSGFREAQPVASATFNDRREAVMADLDGDGVDDLIVQSINQEPKLEWFKVSKRQAPAEFSSWIAPTGLKGNLAGPLSDGDGDGATNWEEFVFGSDPAAVDPAHSARPRLEKQGNAWTYSYQRRVGLASPPKVQTSTDLKTWNDATPVAPSAQPAAPGYEWISEDSNGEDALFFRTVIPNPN